MSSIQLKTLREEFEYMKQDISDVGVATFISWCNRVGNFIWRKLRESDPDRFMQTQTFAITSDTQTENLPSNFGKIDTLGCGFYLLDNDNEPTHIQLAKTEYGSSQVGYYLDGGNIVFTNCNGNSYTLVYLPKWEKFTAMTDYFTLDKTVNGVIIVDDEYTEYLVDAIDVKYCQWDEDTVSEGNADQRFANVLSELLEEYNRDTSALSIEQPYNSF